MASALWKTRRSKSDFQIGRPSSLQNTQTGTSFQPLASVSSARRTRSVSSVSPSSSAFDQASPDLDEPAMHVDVAPLQTEELAEAHPGAQRTEDKAKVARIGVPSRREGAALPSTDSR